MGQNLTPESAHVHARLYDQYRHSAMTSTYRIDIIRSATEAAWRADRIFALTGDPEWAIRRDAMRVLIPRNH